MINDKSVIAIIPARAGSKGLPAKNIKILNGKPLIAWSIEKALLCKYLDCICVSTDSQEIADVATRFNAKPDFLRPAALATDTATTYQVVEHALNFYHELHKKFDYIILLEPTSPLREDGDIASMLEMLDINSQEFDSVVSIGEIATEHPSIAKRLSNRQVTPYCSELVLTTRRQDNPAAYFPYGVGYIAKSQIYLQEKTFYTKRCAGYPIRRYQNYEIDDIYDFICVENIMKYEWSNSSK